MLSPTFPWPPHLGSRIRIFHILVELSAAHRVTLVAPVVEGESRPSSFPSLCCELHTVPAASSKTLAAVRSLFSARPYRAAKFCTFRYRRCVSRLLQKRRFDLVWVNTIGLMDCLPLRLQPRSLVVLDQPNDELAMWQGFAREATWAGRAFARQNLWKLRRFERSAFRRLTAVITVSIPENESLRRRLPEACLVWKFPNGVDSEYFHPDPDGKVGTSREILFCGSLDVSMNSDAAEYFAGEIYPRIRRSLPGAIFRIVGRSPSRRLRRLSRQSGIVVTGTVPDVRPYYQNAAVAVAPFRLGAGTKLKILEAMAMGVPVVSTALGAQGMEVADGEHIFIEDQPHRFADRVLDLFRDGRLAREMAWQARRLVENAYCWKRLLADLNPMLERLQEERGGAA
jgi:sugar transferase (PEP-CTERM/EpsH1 system associated)